jgi:membrane-bound lytic murein transglycosylase MltF
MPTSTAIRACLCLALALGAAGLPAGAAADDKAPAPAASDALSVPAAEAEPEPSEEDILVQTLAAPWTGDLDGIVERGFLRVGTVYNPVLFSYDGSDQRGLVVDIANELQQALRKKLGKAAASLTIVLAPLPRDKLIPFLERGQVDLVIANLTITAQRSEKVDFTRPVLKDVSELVVTGPSAPAIATLDDLAGVLIHVRTSSSYHEHLVALNAARTAEGKPPLRIEPVNENMEDSDILDLVSAGTIPLGIVDSHMARLYAQIIDGLTVRDDLVINSGGDIAWAVRKGSPQLLAALDDFVKASATGTLLGNMLRNRYFKDTQRVKNAMDAEGEQRLSDAYALIRQYARQYDFDSILIAAQGYQESGLDQSKRSPVGAVGIMQVMPATARDPNVGIPDIHIADRNVEAGVKYLRFLRDRYFSDPAMDEFNQTLFAFAAYNAGPGNIAKARRRAEKMGLDLNVWFGSVELAAAKVVSREPVVYVRNILKYYVTYQVYRQRLEEKAQP